MNRKNKVIMGVVTIFRLSEECGRLIYGGNIPVAGKVSLFELKIAVAQVANALLKTDILTINGPMREAIPNGTVLGLYQGIPVAQWGIKSACQLPIKPIKLPRNMGVFSIFNPANPDQEYIPLQMGQFAMAQSQPNLINSILGQCGYEVYGMQVVFTKDLSSPNPNAPTLVSMRLAILDISQYGDFDPLPILPEMEWQIKQEVVRMFAGEAVADRVVDPGRKEQKGIPLSQQAQQ